MIPKRAKLIERVEDLPVVRDYGPSSASIAALLDAEIRRAVAEELEALRAEVVKPVPGRIWSLALALDARLAALRAEQAEQPPGSSTERARADAAPQNSARTEQAPQGQDAGSTPAPGATEHDRPGTAEGTTQDDPRQGRAARAEPRQSAGPGSATFESDTMNFGGAEGRAASSPCPPPAFPPAATDPEKLRCLANVCRVNARAAGNGHVALTQLEIANTLDSLADDRVAPPPSSAESDARALERAAEIHERLNQPGAAGILRSTAAQIRSAAPEPEVDVFEAFDDAYLGREWCIEKHTAEKMAREWFGPTVAYVKTMAARPCVQPGKDCGWCDSCEARLEMAALRRRATEARR